MSGTRAPPPTATVTTTSTHGRAGGASTAGKSRGCECCMQVFAVACAKLSFLSREASSATRVCSHDQCRSTHRGIYLPSWRCRREKPQHLAHVYVPLVLYTAVIMYLGVAVQHSPLPLVVVGERWWSCGVCCETDRSCMQDAELLLSTMMPGTYCMRCCCLGGRESAVSRHTRQSVDAPDEIKCFFQRDSYSQSAPSTGFGPNQRHAL